MEEFMDSNKSLFRVDEFVKKRKKMCKDMALFKTKIG